MQRNYVTNTRFQQQQKYADQEEIAKKNIKLAMEWQRQRRQRNLEMNLAHRQHSHDVPIKNYAVFSNFAYPGEAFVNTTRLPVWSNGNKGEVEFWNERQNSYCDIEQENIENTTEGDIHQVVRKLTTLGRFLEIVQNCPLPRLSFTTACIIFLLAIFISPRPCVQSLLFPAFRLSFGTLYPAYASYKAVRTKNVKEYVKWMMYWIVYAFFTCIETFTDIFLSWFPFYYEVKVIIVLWLLSPATKGSSTLYRKFVHPMLTRREQEIDDYLNQAKERGYSAVLQLGSKGVNYATNVIMQTALKGGGNLVQTLRRSYSLSDLSEPDLHRTQDEIDDVCKRTPTQRILRPRMQTALGRSASGTRHSTGMYFTEVDVSSKGSADLNYSIRSSEDISSGYSSAEPISIGLSRTSSMTNASKARLKAKRSEEEWSNTYVNHAQYCVPYEDGIFYSTNLGEDFGLPLINDMNHEAFQANERNLRGSNILSDLEKTSSTEKSEEIENPFNLSDKNEILSSMTEAIGNDKVENNMADYERNMTNDLLNKECDQVSDSNNVTVKGFNITNNLLSRGNVASHKLENDDSENDEFMDTISTNSSNVEIKCSLNQEPQNFNDQQLYLSTEDVTIYSKEIFIEAPSNASPQVHKKESLDLMEKDDSKNVSMKPIAMTPKDLKLALEEIKDSFRANINLDNNENITRNKARPSHNKGHAPAPPAIPPRPAKVEQPIICDTLSVHSSTNSNSRSSSPCDRRTSKKTGIFKNLKSSIFRTESKPVIDGSKNSRASAHKETEI